MARLLISVVVVAIAAGLVLAFVSGARRMSSGRFRKAEAGRGVPVMKQMSFVLLVALIFYASIWGAG